jgi:4a-hydroxytetrahydrobiopterin dehydratase
MSGEGQKMQENEIVQLLKSHPDWTYNQDKRLIEKAFSFKSYLKTISFVNAIAWLANNENHHPDLIVSFGKCIVQLTTHDENGVGKKDFLLAKKIDDL